MKIQYMFLLAVLFISSAGQKLSGQDYRSFSTFGGDTLSYVRYNFMGHKSQYIGQPASMVFNRLELEIKSYLDFEAWGTDSIDGIYLSFYGENEDGIRLANDRKMIDLIIYFKDYIPMNDLRNLFAKRKQLLNWTSQVREFFGSKIVEDIGYLLVPDVCEPTSSIFNRTTCAQCKCDPLSNHFDPMSCVDQTVTAYYKFEDLSDKSQYGNSLTLHEGALITSQSETANMIDNNLILMGGSPWDILHPHATVANSPSLNPQYITVAARIKPQDFYGCGNDAIVNKPFTSHTAPYYQYNLGICGTYCGGGGHYFTFSCSINGSNQGMYSPPSVWIPGQWYTVVGTYDGTILKLYVNGVMVASKSVTGTIDSYNTDEFIGKHGNVDYSIPAELDWIKVYNRALSDTEIAALGAH